MDAIWLAEDRSGAGATTAVTAPVTTVAAAACETALWADAPLLPPAAAAALPADVRLP